MAQHLDLAQMQRDVDRIQLPQLVLYARTCPNGHDYESAFKEGDDCPVCEAPTEKAVPAPRPTFAGPPVREPADPRHAALFLFVVALVLAVTVALSRCG